MGIYTQQETLNLQCAVVSTAYIKTKEECDDKGSIEKKAKDSVISKEQGVSRMNKRHIKKAVVRPSLQKILLDLEVNRFIIVNDTPTVF